VSHLLAALLRAGRAILPEGRQRVQLLALVLVGSAIPLAELMVTKLFTDVVTAESSATLGQLAPQLAVFLGLFLATRCAHFAQRVARVRFFEHVFRGGTPGWGPAQESWRWALGLELVNILTFATQVVAMLAFFTVLSPPFGAADLVLVVVLLEMVGRLYARLVATQHGFAERQRAGQPVSSHERVRSRILSTELAGLGSSVGVLVLLVGLVAMGVAGVVSTSDTIVLFLGLRMQNSTIGALSGSVMRFARAEAKALPSAAMVPGPVREPGPRV
jgi:hypothetical protein